MSEEEAEFPGEPLQLSHIERIPKKVFFDKDYTSDVCKSATDADFKAAVEIRQKIVSGSDLRQHYRSSTRRDDLLITDSVLHLHLSSRASSALLYMVQFKQCVLFLRIATHVHVDETPAGRTLFSNRMVRQFLIQFEKKRLG